MSVQTLQVFAKAATATCFAVAVLVSPIHSSVRVPDSARLPTILPTNIPSFLPVTLSDGKGLMVSETEVTVSQWSACVAAGECEDLNQDGAADHPMVNVNWNDVQTYMTWLGKAADLPLRAPSYLEWMEIAADHAPRPRKPLFTDPRLAWAADYDLTASPHNINTEAATSFGANKHGLFGFNSNVWEWTNDCSVDHASMPKETYGCLTGRVAMGKRRVALPEQMRITGNPGCSLDQPPANVGFRLVYAL